MHRHSVSIEYKGHRSKTIDVAGRYAERLISFTTSAEQLY